MRDAPVPMLARLESRLPTGDHWRYEPKFDGFRGFLWHRAGHHVELLSRHARDLTPYFPELVNAGRSLEPGTLLDGEIVISDEHGSTDFGALQERLTLPRKNVPSAARERPAILVVFDVLELAGADMTDRSLRERRRALESVLESRHACLQLITHTDNITLAPVADASNDRRSGGQTCGSTLHTGSGR